MNSQKPLTFLSEEELLFRETVAEFAEAEIRPAASEMDEQAKMRPEIIDQLFELGLMGIGIPEELGGAGASFFMSVIAVEELSRVDPAVGVVCDVQNTLVNEAILSWGSDSQKARLLPLLATEWIGAYSLSESTSGSDAFSLATRADRQGDKFILNGQKLWVTNGAEADIFIVFASVDPSAGYRGITAFLVDRETPGIKVGTKEDKLGIRASSTCEILLEDCAVAADQVLGEVGKGYKVAIETLNRGRIGIGAQMVGLAGGSLSAAIDYSKQRQAFGKPISTFQAVQFSLAEMSTELEAARLLVYNAARAADCGLDVVESAAKAKLFSSRVAEKIASQALEIFGGYGFTKDYPAEKYFRDAKIGTIYEGTSNMQLATIAKKILG